MAVDARVASEKARDYFASVHGSVGAWAFEIESAERDGERKAWAVECSFLSAQAANQRSTYRILVSDEDGSILSVNKVKITPK